MKELIEHEYLVNMKSQVKIAEELGLTEWKVRKLMKEYDIPSRGVGYVGRAKKDFFEKIDSSEKAYILGLIESDGSVSENFIRLELKSDDEDILKKIVDIVSPGNKVSRNRNCSYISICSTKLVKDLEKYGVVKRKSLILESLTNLVPEEFYHDYVRGLFDGDGTVSLNKHGYLRIGYNSGSKSFLEDFRKQVCERAKMSMNGTYFGTVFFTSWGAKSDIKAFHDYIYQNNPTLFLERKFNKISRYVNTEVI